MRLGVHRCLPLLLGLVAASHELAALQFPEVTIADTHQRLLRSAEGREYQISIALPYGYAESDREYPLLVILDANGQFGTVTETVRALALIEESIPQVLVVGVGYPVGVYWNAISPRALDLSPTRDKAWEREAREVWTRFPAPEGFGGAATFLRFLDEQLIPMIESEYRVVADDRTIYGFSLGGIFVLYTLFHAPDLFDQYVAGSPSLFWDDEVMFRYEEAFSRVNTALPKRLFMSVGLSEGDERMVEPLRRFVRRLQGRGYEGLKLDVHFFEGETHDSAVPGTVSRGLKTIYFGR